MGTHKNVWPLKYWYRIEVVSVMMQSRQPHPLIIFPSPASSFLFFFLGYSTYFDFLKKNQSHNRHNGQGW